MNAAWHKTPQLVIPAEAGMTVMATCSHSNIHEFAYATPGLNPENARVRRGLMLTSLPCPRQQITRRRSLCRFLRPKRLGIWTAGHWFFRKNRAYVEKSASRAYYEGRFHDIFQRLAQSFPASSSLPMSACEPAAPSMSVMPIPLSFISRGKTGSSRTTGRPRH